MEKVQKAAIFRIIISDVIFFSTFGAQLVALKIDLQILS